MSDSITPLLGHLPVSNSGTAFSTTRCRIGHCTCRSSVKQCWGWCFPENVVREFVPALCRLLLLLSSALSLSDSYPSGFCCYEALQLEWKKLCRNSLARGGTGWPGWSFPSLISKLAENSTSDTGSPVRSLLRALFCSQGGKGQKPHWIWSKLEAADSPPCSSPVLSQGEHTAPRSCWWSQCWVQPYSSAADAQHSTFSFFCLRAAPGDTPVLWLGLEEQGRGTAPNPAPVAKAALGEMAQ